MFLQICKWAISTQPHPPIKDVVIETTVTEISSKMVMDQEQDGQATIKDRNIMANFKLEIPMNVRFFNILPTIVSVRDMNYIHLWVKHFFSQEIPNVPLSSKEITSFPLKLENIGARSKYAFNSGALKDFITQSSSANTKLSKELPLNTE